ncbi:hypothetical protein [Bacillus sp. FJAT-49736]|uniref:hypothetical protein n=1 Tax=Bacillus sp. FJAT-49736 TaxID=2833582 RepID=UPI001BC987D9|nr:hypothetical protein [Bacillus sp. FJAT-49736]MBS4174305.1 hypothetical protein [Bacillus sp. FJAT-49736]
MMKKIIGLLVVLFCFLTSSVMGQAASVKTTYKEQFEKTFGKGNFYNTDVILQMDDQSYFMAGTKLLDTDPRFTGWYSKFDKNGKLLWSKDVKSSSGYSFGFKKGKGDVELWEMKDSKIYITLVHSNGSYTVKKYAPPKFSFNYDLEKVIKAKDGGYLVVLTDDQALEYIKLNANYQTKWDTKYSFKEYQTIESVTEAKDGSFLLTGAMKSNIVLYKVDKNGKQTIKSPTFSLSKTEMESGKFIAQRSNGEYVLVTEIRKDYDENRRNRFVLLSKDLKPKSAVISSQINVNIYDAALAKDGSILISGGKGASLYQANFIKATISGKKLVDKAIVDFKPYYSFTVSRIIETKDGGVAVANTVLPNMETAYMEGERFLLFTKFK